MNITELDSPDGRIHVSITDRGLSGKGRVSVRTQTIKSERPWHSDELPAIVTGTLVLSFEEGDLTVNGKTYARWIYATYEPVRADRWNEGVRTVITDTGVKPIGYRALCGHYGDLTDSARSKLCALLPVLADTYLTNDAIKDAIVADALADYDTAVEERRDAEAAEQKAAEHLAAMKALT